MGFSDSFKKRMNRSGKNNGDSIYNQTAQIANNAFSDSPNHEVVKIDGMYVDVRVLEGKTWQDKVLLLRPRTRVKLGSYVELEGKMWMVFDYLGDNISPKIFIKHCNDYLRWTDADGTMHKVLIMASATRNTKYDIKPDTFDMDLLVGGIYAFSKATEEVRAIKPSQRFILGAYVYEISGIDDVTNTDENGEGYLQITCKLTTNRDSDDWTLKIADNSQLHDSENGIQEGSGDLW